jgi:hypothetical protein
MAGLCVCVCVCVCVCARDGGLIEQTFLSEGITVGTRQGCDGCDTHQTVIVYCAEILVVEGESDRKEETCGIEWRQ